jgi:hypothetical protein
MMPGWVKRSKPRHNQRVHGLLALRLKQRSAHVVDRKWRHSAAAPAGTKAWSAALLANNKVLAAITLAVVLA